MRASTARRRCAISVVIGALVVAGVAPAVFGAERYGWFGVRIRDLSETETEDLAVKLGVGEGYGVVVAEVLKDAPAETSGLRAGDLIVAIDGRPVVETRALQRIVGATPAGGELKVVVLRDGRRRELRVRVGEMPPDVVAERIAAEFGFLVRDPAGEEAPAGSTRPPVVAAVLERSAAERGGLKVGDRILAVNGLEVGSVDAFRRRVQDAALRDSMRLRVERQGEPVSLVLPPVQPSLPSH
ncbi:MAG TPA: PDZ domain-containing protein [Methylomirabilota bacterium]|jgi:serine protease Do|nr:PDZ domain-containing protein [Methylomirabilota bacterium]